MTPKSSTPKKTLAEVATEESLNVIPIIKIVVTQEKVSIETFLKHHLTEARIFSDGETYGIDLYMFYPGSAVLTRAAYIDLTYGEWLPLDRQSYKLIEFAKANKDRIKPV